MDQGGGSRRGSARIWPGMEPGVAGTITVVTGLEHGGRRETGPSLALTGRL